MKRLLVFAALLVFAMPASAGRLPILASHNWWPIYSPDSKFVAFTNVDGQGRIFTLEVADGASGKSRQLARSRSQLLPSWSPDSKAIAYQAGGHIRTVSLVDLSKRDVAVGLYPAWSPDGKTIAYVADGVLHAGSATFGSHVLGPPSWSPDGKRIAYAQTDGIYVDATRIATPAQEVRTVVFSNDGKSLAYVSGGNVYVVGADGSAPVKVAGPFRNVSPLDWSNTSDELSYTADNRLVVSDANGGWHTQRVALGAAGASYAPASPHSDILAYSGPNPNCPGHDAIRLYQIHMLTGSCRIDGTPLADVILGTSKGGDVIAAGAGNDTIRARNGRHDLVNCGPGRDTVYADRSDRLIGCEIIRR